MNSLTIIGRLTRDPESRVVNTQTGQNTVCSYTVATDNFRNGQKAAIFFRVSTWGRRAENDQKYLRKGSQVAVTGSIDARAYSANDGTLRASLELFNVREVEYLGSAQPQESDAAEPAGAVAPPPPPPVQTMVETDDLPF